MSQTTEFFQGGTDNKDSCDIKIPLAQTSVAHSSPKCEISKALIVRITVYSMVILEQIPDQKLSLTLNREITL